MTDQILKHHKKYKEIHGIDEVVLMTKSDHVKLHMRLRKEGKCNVSIDDMKIISNRAKQRKLDILHENNLTFISKRKHKKVLITVDQDILEAFDKHIGTAKRSTSIAKLMKNEMKPGDGIIG